MGVNTDYLGHVEIRAVTESSRVCLAGPFARSRRSYRSGGPYAVIPEDPQFGALASTTK